MDTSVEEAATASFLGESSGDGAGRSVAFAGDVNDDGFDDILIGANYRAGSAGETYLILGKASWLGDEHVARERRRLVSRVKRRAIGRASGSRRPAT